ncbi:OmpA/MotB family protein [Amycolatopsis jiangsuensis]|uniref:Outer membrane protein OmpA-like peptidoglycan-associated protein n=1 Tax=Amycolatopsis jiangsuensis TaxID=1181879 RepID=A0A840J3C3_9PSEU|nr:OmpA family protein [Amycolatopsis jiangsuensis]MBB4687908.1 outer membrane protein OmpA-like peptidoglycan-associated protein [Amycolatopsis jiangsuensis]
MSGARGWFRLIPVAVLVTALLAGLATWLRADGIEADLAGRARSALDSAGIRGGEVRFSGRQATLEGVPAEQSGRALGIVQGVEGVESAQASGGAGPATSPPMPSTSAAPSSPPPSSPAPPSTPPTDRAGIQAELDRKLADTPITFEPDSARLTDEGEKAARELAPLFRDAPNSLRYRITGHVADGPGGRSAARKLSRNRALTVVRLLIREDVPADRLLALGTSTTPEGSGSDDDRRVEITVEQR